MLGAFLVREDGSAITKADIETEKPLPAIRAMRSKALRPVSRRSFHRA